MSSNDLTTTDFEGLSIHTVTYKGRPAWIAREVGAALGYHDDGRRLISNLTDKWSGDFIAGTDMEVVAGEPLSDLKALIPDSGMSRAPSITLLYESGVHLVCLKTNKPAGRRLRRWLVDEVLPQIARTGSYQSAAEVEQPKALEVDPLVQLRIDREARLNRKMKSRALERLVARLRKTGTIDEDVLLAYEVEAAEIASGRNLSELRPRLVERRWTPTEIAEDIEQEYGTKCTPNRVGRIISRLGLRQDTRYARPVVNKSQHSDRTVTSYDYTAEAVELVKVEWRRMYGPQDAA